MAPVTRCPSRELLERVAAGAGTAAETESLASHIEVCTACGTAVDAVLDRDPLVRDARKGGAASGTDAPRPSVVESLIARLRRAGPSALAKADTASADEPETLPGAPTPPTASDFPFLAPAELPDELGRLGPYRVLDLLGRGGMGLVFLAEDRQLRRRVALKVMCPRLAADLDFRRRFLREARAMAAVEHDHVVPVFQIGQERGVPFLAMPLLKGETLESRLRREKSLPLSDVLRIAGEIAEGLAAARARGPIHRDVKPTNVWLEAIGGDCGQSTAPSRQRTRVKLLDFGLARPAESRPDGALTDTGLVAGTPQYMSPEQTRGEEADARADLFSLGCVLFRMLTGRPAYQANNAFSALAALSAYAPPEEEQFGPDVPAVVRDLVRALLAKSPEDRAASARAVAESIADLAKAQEGDLLAGIDLGGIEPLPGLRKSKTAKRRPRPVQAATQSRPAVWSRPRYWSRRTWTAGGASIFGIGALWAVAVLLLSTPEGTLRVEINDPEVEVTVKGTDIVLKPEPQGTEVRLSPGEKTLVVTRGKLQFETDRLVLRKNETVAVRVELLSDRIEVRQGATVLGEGQLTEPAVPPVAAGWHGWPADAPPPAVAHFDEAQARRHQDDWAEYLGVPPEYTNSLGMRFRLIPPGEFLMGSTAEQIERLRRESESAWFVEHIENEAPQHQIVLTRPFFLGEHEVTQKDYEAVMRVNPSSFARTGTEKAFVERVIPLDTSNHPVESVSWNDAAEFCARLSRSERLKPFYVRSEEMVTFIDNGEGYQLPTEAQWEFACGAGTTTRRWAGDTHDDAVRFDWLIQNSGGRTHSVGELGANPFGLHDLYGNVTEWCEDLYDAREYVSRAGPITVDPRRALRCSSYVIRGWNWSGGSHNARTTNRNEGWSGGKENHLGFRVALPLQTVQMILGGGPAPGPLGGSGLEFDSVDDHVDLGRWALPAGAVTFEAWVTPAAADKGMLIWFGAPRWLALEVNMGHWQMASLGAEGPSYGRYSADTMLPGRRVHVAGIWDGRDKSHLFLDGAPQARSGADDIGWTWPGRPAASFAQSLDGHSRWHGVIHAIRISRGVRYTEPFLPPDTFANDTDTLALYLFDEGEGEELKDSSGNGHHGRIVGARWLTGDDVPRPTVGPTSRH